MSESNITGLNGQMDYQMDEKDDEVSNHENCQCTPVSASGKGMKLKIDV